jgi:hypothetical protein
MLLFVTIPAMHVFESPVVDGEQLHTRILMALDIDGGNHDMPWRRWNRHSIPSNIVLPAQIDGAYIVV